LTADRQELEARRSELQEVTEERKHLAKELETLNAAKNELQLQQQQLTETEQQIARAREELLQTRLEWEAATASQPALRSSEPRPFSLPAEFLAASEAARQKEHDANTADADDEQAENIDLDLTGLQSPQDNALRESEPAAPEESEDLFARLRALDILKGNRNETQQDSLPTNIEIEPESADEGAVPATASSFSPATPPSPLAPAVTPEPGVEDEESIDDYMARLLQRVGRGAGASALAPAQTSSPARKPSEITAAEPIADQARSTSAIAEAEAPMKSLSELEPRTAAPEKSRDLAAMREIANFTARTAIAKHAWKTRVVMLLKRFALGIVALACGLILILLAPAMSSHYFLCGLAAITAALLWFLPAIYRARKCNNQAQNAQQQAVDDYENSPAEDNQNRSR
jgi:hypothetical protein